MLFQYITIKLGLDKMLAIQARRHESSDLQYPCKSQAMIAQAHPNTERDQAETNIRLSNYFNHLR